MSPTMTSDGTDSDSSQSDDLFSFKPRRSAPTNDSGTIGQGQALNIKPGPRLAGLYDTFNQYEREGRQRPIVREPYLRDDAQSEYYSVQSTVAESVISGTDSTGLQSQYGATWQQSMTMTANCGFASGTPRTEGWKGVREGREKGMGLPHERGVGRTGKAPAPVPPGMVEAASKSMAVKEESPLPELIEAIKRARLGQEAEKLEPLDSFVVAANDELLSHPQANGALEGHKERPRLNDAHQKQDGRVAVPLETIKRIIEERYGREEEFTARENFILRKRVETGLRTGLEAGREELKAAGLSNIELLAAALQAGLQAGIRASKEEREKANQGLLTSQRPPDNYRETHLPQPPIPHCISDFIDRRTKAALDTAEVERQDELLRVRAAFQQRGGRELPRAPIRGHERLVPRRFRGAGMYSQELVRRKEDGSVTIQYTHHKKEGETLLRKEDEKTASSSRSSSSPAEDLIVSQQQEADAVHSFDWVRRSTLPEYLVVSWRPGRPIIHSTPRPVLLDTQPGTKEEFEIQLKKHKIDKAVGDWLQYDGQLLGDEVLGLPPLQEDPAELESPLPFEEGLRSRPASPTTAITKSKAEFVNPSSS